MSPLLRFRRARVLSLGCALASALLAGCAVPLGPGYRIRRETVTVGFYPGGRALSYTARIQVQNVGNSTLHLLRVRAPQPLAGGAFATQAASTGGPSSAAPSSAGSPSPREWLPVPLNPPLGPLLPKHSVVVPFGYIVPTSGDAVLLEPRNWFPAFLPPPGLFAKAESRAPKMQLEIQVPRGYAALATGRFVGVRSVATGTPVLPTEYRYELDRQDFLPFLLVGRYSVRDVRRGGSEVAFWTRAPISEACAGAWAAHLASTAAFYRSAFGRIAKHRRPIPMIELPPESASWTREAGAGFGSVPGGVWFSVSPSDLCGQPKSSFAAADRALAATWFGWDVAPEPGAQALLGLGAPRYAAWMAEEAEGRPAAAVREVEAWIREYDRLSRAAQPLAPSRLDARASATQWEMAGIQSALCLIALEDRFGRPAVRGALAHLVGTLGGESAGLAELRSALEQEIGQDLYAFFDQWLGRPRIPSAFRAHYASAAAFGGDRGESRRP